MIIFPVAHHALQC